MNDRRNCKSKNQRDCQNLNRTIHSECRKAEERLLEERCAEIEYLGKKDQIKYSKVKDLVGKKKYN